MLLLKSRRGFAGAETRECPELTLLRLHKPPVAEVAAHLLLLLTLTLNANDAVPMLLLPLTLTLKLKLSSPLLQM